MINTKPLPYAYKITHKTTNQFYIGSRTSKNQKHHSEDLGFKYFTSSKTVKELGFENFKIDWIEEFPSAELAYDWEQMMIHVNLRDPLCLNKHCTFGKVQWSTAGIPMSKESKDKISKATKGKVLSYAHKQKLSKARTGKNNPMFGKTPSAEHKLRISNAKKGKIRKPHSDETRLKISNSLKGNKAPNFGKKAWNRGMKTSDEIKLKISLAHKGKIKPKVKCQYCNKEMIKSNHTRWHGDNCKFKRNYAS